MNAVYIPLSFVGFGNCVFFSGMKHFIPDLEPCALTVHGVQFFCPEQTALGQLPNGTGRMLRPTHSPARIVGQQAWCTIGICPIPFVPCACHLFALHHTPGLSTCQEIYLAIKSKNCAIFGVAVGYCHKIRNEKTENDTHKVQYAKSIEEKKSKISSRFCEMVLLSPNAALGTL